MFDICSWQQPSLHQRSASILPVVAMDQYLNDLMGSHAHLGVEGDKEDEGMAQQLEDNDMDDGEGMTTPAGAKAAIMKKPAGAKLAIMKKPDGAKLAIMKKRAGAKLAIMKKPSAASSSSIVDDDDDEEIGPDGLPRRSRTKARKLKDVWDMIPEAVKDEYMQVLHMWTIAIRCRSLFSCTISQCCATCL